MEKSLYVEQLSKCVRCGICKSFCPTYQITLNESMGARGRIAMLGELGRENLSPTKNLADKIFSCMLCGACKSLCPTGVDIPEMIYQGRVALKKSFRKGRLLRSVLRHSITRLDNVLPLLRMFQKTCYKPLYKAGITGYIPEITSKPFKNSVQVYKNIKKINRVAIFAGCSVNYFYPRLGNALSSILLKKGYEVVVFKGEACCGAPLRSLGLEQEASHLANKNIEHFNKVRAEAIISLCPTCTMVIREQYPLLTGGTISDVMDVNEFLISNDIISGLECAPAAVTYHDPCHLSFGLGVRDKPRQILKSIKGIELIEMKHSDECCGFAGLFSRQFREISKTISNKKMENIINTSADTVVTSCPGCIMQIEALKRKNKAKINIKHIVEVIDESMP